MALVHSIQHVYHTSNANHIDKCFCDNNSELLICHVHFLSNIVILYFAFIQLLMKNLISTNKNQPPNKLASGLNVI